ncbi:MAG: hypothetical protein ACOZQL_08265 [Myxococcota bacterium]
MLLRALGVMALMAVPASAGAPAPQPQPRNDARAECLKMCAGAPKDADGRRLLACLTRCEPAFVDGGTP